MTHFSTKQKIMFQHCDPAGIVFYPRYFEMINAIVECWFDEGLNVPFSQLHNQRGSAIPTVSIDTVFKAPSGLGDVLDMILRVKKLGRTSMDLQIAAVANDITRLETNLTLVHVDQATKTPKIWPEDIRQNVENLLKESP